MLTAARWLMLLYVAVLPVVRPLDTRILGVHIFAMDLIFAAAFFFWLASLLDRKPRFEGRYLIFAGSFFLALLISAVFSVEPRKSFLKLSGVFYLIAVSIVIADLVRDISFLKNLTFAWLAGALLTILGSCLGLAGFLAGFDSPATNFFLFGFGSLPPGHYPRVRAFFENPNMMANYINVALMIILGGWKAGWLAARTAWGVSILLLGSALLAVSPGVGGIVLSVGLWVWFAPTNGIGRARTPILVGSIALAFLAFLSTTISPVVRNEEKAITLPLIEKQLEPSVRVLVWRDSLERGSQYPIFGRGPGTDVAFFRYQVASGQKQLLRDGHQAWLNVFGQTGVVGLAAFVALCWYLFTTCRFRAPDDSERSAMLAACSCAFVGAFLFQNLFGSFEDARQLWVLIGMLVGLAGTRVETT